MMLAAARVRCIPLTSFVGTSLRPNHIINRKPPTLTYNGRTYGTGQRSSTGRIGVSRSPTLKERLMAPAGDSAFQLGKGLLAGASALGIGALCFYGTGMGSEVGTIDTAALWPDYVKARVRDTYMYFGGSIAVTAASAVVVMRSPVMMNLMMKNSIMSLVGTIAAMIGSGMLVRSIPYQEGFGAKQLAWMVHCGIIGAVIAPLTMMGGPLVIRAATYTAGVVGSLSMLAICAPSDKFLTMRGPLAMGLGFVFISSIGTWFLPASTALGASMYSISMYGGLVVFSGFLLYDTQRIMKRAETYPHPMNDVVPYDPINESVGIYLDTVNIFIRILIMMMGGGGKKR